MSGIGIILNKSDRPVALDEIKSIADALSIYGRNYQSTQLMSNIAFAYTHFDTNHTQHTAQPISNEKYIILFDGRLDNRNELARLIGLKLPRLNTISDAELAMHCWERWQTNALNKLYGEFALIVWDQKNKHLQAARDQIGRRILHYYETANRLVITSAPSGILALSDIPKTINTQKIADSLCNIYTASADQSYFKDIKALPPAHLLDTHRDKTTLRQYYDIAAHRQKIRYASDDEYVEAATEHFENAVQSCIQSTKKVGAFMSGGLDSSSVAVTASKFLTSSTSRLNTYTSVPEQAWDRLTESNSYGDETPYVEVIAKHYPHIKTNLINAEGLSFYHQQDNLLDCMQMPIRNTLNTTWLNVILGTARLNNIGIMLGGELGNAILSHTGKGIYAYLWHEKRIKALYKEFMINTEHENHLNQLRSFKKLLSTIAPEWLWQIRQNQRKSPTTDHLLRHSAINPELAEQLHMSERVRHYLFNDFKRPNPLERSENFWNWLQQTQAPSDTGNILQGFRAMYGIELRDPFADRRLIEWSIGIPEDQFRHHGQKRWLIKRMMQGKLPNKVLHKPKDIGRQMPDWHLRISRDLPRIREELEHYKQDQDIAMILNIPKLQKLIDRWPTQTITDKTDDLRILLPGTLPHALQTARFLEKMKK